MNQTQIDLTRVLEMLEPGKKFKVAKNSNEFKALYKLTDFLPDTVAAMERAKYIKFGLTEQVKCPVCGVPTKLEQTIKHYSKPVCCSKQCRIESRIQTMNEVDPKTGLTRGAVQRLKAKQTLSKIDPETGLTGYQKGRQSQHHTMSLVDTDTNRSGYSERVYQMKHNIKAGLDTFERSAIKAKQTLSKIDPESGVSGYELLAAKTKIANNKINTITGLTGYQSGSINTTKKKRFSTYNRILSSLAGNFELLTTIDEFVESYQGDYISKSSITYKCTKCDTVRTSAYAYIRCLECSPYSVSMPEKEVFDFCSRFAGDLESSNRTLIDPLEIDIYSEKYKLAIEFDGIYWHSSDSVINEKKDYHLEKTQLCEQQGIQLLHIFENEWKIPEKRLIWKSIIRNKFGKSNRIFARKCVIKPVDSKTTKLFLDNNHLQGSYPSSINYGLYYDEELVSLMTFGKSRYNKKYKYELLRFCSILSTSVAGGASRLFKHFSKNHDGSVISYADKRRSDGNLYKQLGFELSHETEPNYFYVDVSNPSVLHSRVKFQKHKLPGLLEVFDKSKTESENMYHNGYRKIYDCGNYVFVYN